MLSSNILAINNIDIIDETLKYTNQGFQKVDFSNVILGLNTKIS